MWGAVIVSGDECHAKLLHRATQNSSRIIVTEHKLSPMKAYSFGVSTLHRNHNLTKIR